VSIEIVPGALQLLLPPGPRPHSRGWMASGPGSAPPMRAGDQSNG
jgi:hypothetical protein